MRRIYDKNNQELVCIAGVMDYNDLEKGTFLTDISESLQVGSLYFEKGKIVEPHIHRIKQNLTLYPIVELLLVLGGSASLDIYDEQKELVATVTVVTGDMILLKRGGHGLSFDDSFVRLLDIRPGNYIDKKHDKEMIE